MSEQFIIRVEARFEAAHNLTQYKGAPEPIHGHSWKVEAKFKCLKLDHEHMGIDYVHVEKAIRQLASRYDHRFINEIAPFDKLSPTSENIAKWFYNELDKPEIKQNSELIEVIVWEGPEAYVSYSKI